MDNKRKERTTLFVGDLSSVCTETDLEQAFSVYGQVQQVRIQRNRMTMASMAYGFVRMTNPVESINAKNALDGTLLCGRKLRVREAEYGVGGADKGFLRKYSLYIKFESTEEGKKTNEVKIRDISSQYGEVSDISLRKIFFDKHTGLQKGYGFIHFSNSSEGIQASFNVIADIPQIIVDGVIYVIEASNNLKSRIDAIVQDTPEAADELSDAKAFIMNSGNNNNNHGRGGNRNNGYHQNQGGYGGGRGHRNRNHNGYDGYDDHGSDMHGYSQQGMGGMQMNSNGEMEWNPNLHRQMHPGGMNQQQQGYHGRQRFPNNQRNDGGYNGNYNSYGAQNHHMMHGNPGGNSNHASQLDGRSKPFQPGAGPHPTGMNPNVQEFNAGGAGFNNYGGGANANPNSSNFGPSNDGFYGGGEGSNVSGPDNFQYQQSLGDGAANMPPNYGGNYSDGNINFGGGYMGGGMNGPMGGMGAHGGMPMNGDFHTDNWLNHQQGGGDQGFYPNPPMGMNNNPPMPSFPGGRPHGMPEWGSNSQSVGQGGSGSSHGSFDGSPALGPVISDLSPLYNPQQSGGGLMAMNSMDGAPVRHSSSISSADEDEIARMLGSLDASSSRSKSGSGGLSMDSLMFGGSKLPSGESSTVTSSAEDTQA